MAQVADLAGDIPDAITQNDVRVLGIITMPDDRKAGNPGIVRQFRLPSLLAGARPPHITVGRQHKPCGDRTAMLCGLFLGQAFIEEER